MWRSALITWRMQIRRWGMSTPSQRMFSDGRQLRRIPPDFSQSFCFFVPRKKQVRVWSCKRVVKVVYSQTAPPSCPNLLRFLFCLLKIHQLIYFLLQTFLFAPSLSFASQTSQLSLAGALVCLLTSLLPERERVRGKQKRGKWRDTEREREKETGLIRRHWVSCHNSKRSAGFFSAVRGQTQSSNWERMTGLQTSAVMHGYSSSESACKTIQMSGWSPV